MKKQSEINQQLMRKLYHLQDRFSDRFLVDFGTNFGSIFSPKTYEIGVDFSGPRTLENSSRRREGSPKVQTPLPPPWYKKNRYGSGVKIENLMPAQCLGLLIETNCIISITSHFAMNQLPSDIRFFVKRGSPARLEGRRI